MFSKILLFIAGEAIPRPDLDTLACANADCQQFGRLGQGNLTTRKVYGQDGIRLLRCGSCLEDDGIKEVIDTLIIYPGSGLTLRCDDGSARPR